MCGSFVVKQCMYFLNRIYQSGCKVRSYAEIISTDRRSRKAPVLFLLNSEFRHHLGANAGRGIAPVMK